MALTDAGGQGTPGPVDPAGDGRRALRRVVKDHALHALVPGVSMGKIQSYDF